MTEARFKKIIRNYYKKSGRHDLPWRNTRDPYKILVSEVMLQQTQVARVVKKYEEFLSLFPTVSSLAKAPTEKLLKAWQGLGYNRRALALKRAAESIVRDHGGAFPRTTEALEALPGIGPATAGGILAYAFDIPTVFIETNIRAVYLHFFFPKKSKVTDRDILALIYDSLDTKDPRSWYYALMDYGVHLKQTLPNPSRRSKHHVRQSPFKGSNREVRSRILKLILADSRSRRELRRELGDTLHSIEDNVDDLIREGFIREKDGLLSAA